MKISSIRECESTEEPTVFRQKMLNWYDRHKRDLPWRDCGDPYKIWLSEVMLQQTTVAAVIKYFLKFTNTWPDVHALAAAETDQVMSAWAGLGYYARARNLHKCAKVVSEDFDGIFPSEQAQLKELPGIGDYTSAAIASIAFDRAAVVVDGNIERVMARYHAYGGKKKGLKALAVRYAEGFENRPGDYAQALMDLGATICTPKSPACALCPINDGCAGYKVGESTFYPVKPAKKEKPRRHGYVYLIINSEENILLHKRAAKGLLGGMIGLPTSDWSSSQGIKHLFDVSEFEDTGVTVTHVFTHFTLELKVIEIKNFQDSYSKEMFWFSKHKLEQVGFPSVFKKVIKLVSS